MFVNVQQKECITWAWELLTERLHMPKDRLYITYFGGCPEKGLEPDLEARDIWMSLGYWWLNSFSPTLFVYLHSRLTVY